jgi:phosphatidylglycerol lysyltransferase
VPVSLPTAGPVSARDGITARWLFPVLRGAPVTLAFVVLFWIVGFMSCSIFAGPGVGWRGDVVAPPRSLPDHWWAALVSAFWAWDLPGYVLGARRTLSLWNPRFGI